MCRRWTREARELISRTRPWPASISWKSSRTRGNPRGKVPRASTMMTKEGSSGKRKAAAMRQKTMKTMTRKESKMWRNTNRMKMMRTMCGTSLIERNKLLSRMTRKLKSAIGSHSKTWTGTTSLQSISLPYSALYARETCLSKRLRYIPASMVLSR